MSGCMAIERNMDGVGWHRCLREEGHEGKHGNPPHWYFKRTDGFLCVTGECTQVVWTWGDTCESCEAATDAVTTRLATALALPATATLADVEARAGELVRVLGAAQLYVAWMSRPGVPGNGDDLLAELEAAVTAVKSS